MCGAWPPLRATLFLTPIVRNHMNEHTPTWALYGVLNNPTTPTVKRKLATKYLQMKITECSPKMKLKLDLIEAANKDNENEDS